MDRPRHCAPLQITVIAANRSLQTRQLKFAGLGWKLNHPIGMRRDRLRLTGLWARPGTTKVKG